MYKKLFAKFVTVENIYNAEKQDYLDAGFLSREIYPLLSKSLERAKSIDEYCYKERVGILKWGDSSYPTYLYDIEDPPVLLFYRGMLPSFDDNVAVAMVGTRSASDQGLKTAHRMAFDIASAGGIVISGFARGIDSVCHRGALDAGGFTVAFLGCGIDVTYPPENDALYEKIRSNGCVMTEYFPKTPPAGTNFPVRNRLISAFSRSVTVVEAPVGSGALITAKYAATHGKRLFALPGSLINPSCAGTNMLLRDGVSIALDAYDILGEYEFSFSHRIFLEKIGKQQYYSSEKLGLQKPKDLPQIYETMSAAFSDESARSPSELSGDELFLYELMLKERVVSAEYAAKKGITLDRAVLGLMNLQLKDYIIALPGGLYSVKCDQEKINR